MEKSASGAKKLMIMVAMVALLYGSVVAEAQQNFSKKCLFRAALCIAKCLGKCLVVPADSESVAISLTTVANSENPATCVVECVESKCGGSIAPPPEGTHFL